MERVSLSARVKHGEYAACDRPSQALCYLPSKPGGGDQGLHVVSELQFDRMGIQIDLLLKVRLVVFAHVMADKADRND
jgi:hypothetical protein